MKKLLLIGLVSLPAFGMMVVKDQQGFTVRDGNVSCRVNAWDMDKTSAKLAKMDESAYKRFVEVGGKLRASKMSDGSYYLRDKSGLNGGGPWLAAVTACVTAVGGTAAALGGIGVCLAHGNAPAAGAILVSAPAAIVGATVYATEVALVLPTP